MGRYALLARYTPLGKYPPGRYTPLVGTPTPWQVLPQAGTPLCTGTPLGAVHAGRYRQQVGSMHPTVMHSCYCLSLMVNVLEGISYFCGATGTSV